MTGESDSTSGRRPPTIELKATEVEEPKADTARPREEATAGRSSAETGEQAAAAQARAEPKAAARSRGRLLFHGMSAAIGAIVAAVVLVGLWLASFTLARNVITSPPPKGAATDAASAELSARLDRIERAIQAQRPETVPPELARRITAQDAQTRALNDTLNALNRRLDAIAANAQTAQNQAAAAISAADAVKSAGQSNAQRSDIDALVSRIAAVESAVKTLSDAVAHPTASPDPAARLTIAAQALRGALERGAAYDPELKAVQALGADHDATAALAPFAATGLPQADTLAHELGRLVPALQQATQPASTDHSFLGRLQATAKKLVRITPVDAPPGNDPASVITRISVDAERGDIPAALKDVAALPEAAKSLTADWVKKAQAREAALAASRKIALDALAALSDPAAQ